MEQKRLAESISLAAAMHSNQFDFKGEPYIIHCLRVMMEFDDETTRIVAVLHDIVEDTVASEEMLRNFHLSEEIIQAVMTLTRREGESYEDYIERVSNNSLAAKVKVADLKDNLDGARLVSFGEREAARMGRYIKALKTLA